MQSLANYRSMHMRMQQLAAEGALDGGEPEAAAHRDRAAAGAPPLLRPRRCSTAAAPPPLLHSRTAVHEH